MTVLEKWDVPKPVKLTIEDFMRLDETGAFRNYAKTELIGGTIVAMNAQYSKHAQVKTRLLRRIADGIDAVLPGFDTWSEVSIAIPPGDLPEPDIVVTSYQASGRTPVPVHSAALIVEVADTTAPYDLGTKARMYATAGVPEYWVVDITKRTVHQMWGPRGDGFTERREVAFGTAIRAATIMGLSVETSAL